MRPELELAELGDQFASVINLSAAAVTNSPKHVWLFPKVCSDAFTTIGSGSSPNHGPPGDKAVGLRQEAVPLARAR